MRDEIKEYEAVAKAAEKFVKSVAEGNSEYAKTLFTDDAVLFGILNGNVERGSIEQFYHNVDTVGAGADFKARIDVLAVEETVAVVRVLEEGWAGPSTSPTFFCSLNWTANGSAWQRHTTRILTRLRNNRYCKYRFSPR